MLLRMERRHIKKKLYSECKSINAFIHCPGKIYCIDRPVLECSSVKESWYTGPENSREVVRVSLDLEKKTGSS